MDVREQQERRERRRKRRRRNQIIAYTVLILLILAMAAGVFLGVSFLLKHRQDAKQEEQESQELINELLASEEEIIPTPEPTVEPTPEVVEPTPEEKLDEFIDTQIAAMPLEDKVAGLFFVTPEAITGVGTAVQAGDGTRQALEQQPVGGIIYFAKNMQSKEQFSKMLENTELYSKYPVFFGIDEEGGTVSRLGTSGLGTKTDSAEDIAATGDAENAYQAGVKIGGELSALGINLDFAPVADLANVEGSVMKGRAYGSDVLQASEFVLSMLRGLEEQNVTGCLKHFPGLGSVTQDPHSGMASTDRTAEQFQAEDLQMFQAGIDAGADMIMISNMAAPALTGNNEPCIFSRALVTDILRNQMGFRGVIITDSLTMEAVSEYYGAEEAAVMAVLAGCDMLLMPEDYGKAYQGVLEAVQNGNIDEERVNDSLRRIYRIKYADMLEK